MRTPRFSSGTTISFVPYSAALREPSDSLSPPWYFLKPPRVIPLSKPSTCKIPSTRGIIKSQNTLKKAASCASQKYLFFLQLNHLIEIKWKRTDLPLQARNKPEVCDRPIAGTSSHRHNHVGLFVQLTIHFFHIPGGVEALGGEMVANCARRKFTL